MVYKYYSPKCYNIDAIINRYFYFSKIGTLNDPFDCSIYILRMLKIDRLIPNSAKLNLERELSKYGTCSFSRTPNNMVMWAHYADNYKGFVVEFDDHEFEKLRTTVSATSYIPLKIPYFSVQYIESVDDSESSINYPLEGKEELQISELAKHINDKKILDKFFLYAYSLKYKLWQYEEETRLFAGNAIRGKQPHPDVKYLETGYKIPMPNNCIKSIICGHNMDSCMLDFLKELTRKRNIPLKQTYVSDESFEILIKDCDE